MQEFKKSIVSDKNSSKSRWYPTSIDVLKAGFQPLDHSVDGFAQTQKNLAYNLQYLQFIDKELQELNVSSVITTMLIKTYIITGMGILEGIFTIIIKSNGLWKTNDEEIILSSKSEQVSKTGDKLRIKVEVDKVVPPFRTSMNLDQMIKCLDKHRGVLSIDHLVYPALKRLKDLRNRVHLQIGEDAYDHDYYVFSNEQKNEMQAILYKILCSPNVTDPSALSNYDFLKP